MATPPEYRQADDEREGLTLRDYLGVLWRRKWIIILVTVVATVAAFGFSYRQAKVYEAQADLIYEQQLDVANPLTGQTYTDPTQRTHGAQLGQRDHPEPHHHQSRHHGSGGARGCPRAATRSAPRWLRTQTATGTQSSNVVSVIATSGDAEYSRGRGADLRRPVRGLAQGEHDDPDRRRHRCGRARSCATTRAREGVVGLPHPGAAPAGPADPQGHRHRQLPRARARHGARRRRSRRSRCAAPSSASASASSPASGSPSCSSSSTRACGGRTTSPRCSASRCSRACRASRASRPSRPSW